MDPATGSASVDLPPYSNRGVTLVSAPTDGPCFDAYNATVYANPILLLGRLLDALTEAGHAPQVGEGPPVQFYAQNALLLAPSGKRLLSVRSGGQNGHPFVECKGDHSGVVADTLRRFFDHAPARQDVCIDLRGPAVWDEVCRLCDQFEAEGVILDQLGAKRDNPNRGTTLALGSRHSQCYVRVYQKGLKIAQELGLTGDDIPDELRHWVRVELEYKPDKRPARMKAATLAPAELWGCSPWTRRFAKLALSIDAERVTMNEKRESNEERAWRYMLEQYGPTMLKRIRRMGWRAFVDGLEDDLAKLDAAVMETAGVPGGSPVPSGT